MRNLRGTQTAENLLKAYAREIHVSARYNFYSSIAEEEGYIEISKIFYDIAKEELAHAKRFFQFLKEDFQNEKIKAETDYNVALHSTTEGNLKAALLGENDVWRDLYPKFSKIAKDEGFNNIAFTFDLFAKAEKLHEDIFIKLYNDLRNGRTFKKVEAVKWICINCGIIFEGEEPPMKCPGCLYPRGYFKVYDK